MNSSVKYMDQYDPNIKDWVLISLPRESDSWLDAYPSPKRAHIYACFSKATYKAIVRDMKERESPSSRYYPPNTPYAVVLSSRLKKVYETDDYEGPPEVYAHNGMVVYVWDYSRWLKLSQSKKLKWLAHWDSWPQELRTHMLKNEKFKAGLVGIKALEL